MTTRRPKAEAPRAPDDEPVKVPAEEDLIADPVLSRTTRSYSERTLIHTTFNRDNGAGVITIEQNGHNLMAFTIPAEKPIKEPQTEGN